MQLLIYFRLFFFAVVVFISVLPSRAQENQSLTLTADALKNGGTARTNKLSWKYRAGDDPAWAAREFDDTDWQTVSGSAVNLETHAPNDWRGTSWFRLRFATDESLRGKIVGLLMWQTLGASEIYLDGELLRRFGEIQTGGAEKKLFNVYGMPVAARLTEPGEHIVAVRYQSVIEDPTTNVSKWLFGGGSGGFDLAFADINEEVLSRQLSQRSSISTTFSRFGIYLAVGLLHLLLFWFYPTQRANLYFGIYAFFTAVGAFAGFAWALTGEASLSEFIAFRLLNRLCFALYSTSFLMFLYTAFLPRVPRFAPYVLLLWTAVLAAGTIFPASQVINVVFGIFTVGFVTENLRVMWLAVRRNVDGAWIVAVGVLTALLAPLHYLYNAAGLTMPDSAAWWIFFVSSYGMLAAVSIYLARNFARINKDLSAQIVNVKELSARQIEQERRAAELRLQHEQEKAENARRAQELEEARQLQLSMLPGKLPELPNLEIAAYMRPASEVGGDYYDFHVSGDGTLTAAIGDATGHGLKAGSVVTATKSLFNAFAVEPDISLVLMRISRALKQMNLRGLFMALTVVKIKDNNLIISAAGMPSAVIYRRATQSVEEVSMRALPLGGVANFPYRQQEINLDDGDCVLLMSDGFPEMFNAENEMLGFEKAAEILPPIADQSASEIVDHFVRIGESWAGGRAPDDDVTFVVLKIKSAAAEN